MVLKKLTKQGQNPGYFISSSCELGYLLNFSNYIGTFKWKFQNLWTYQVRYIIYAYICIRIYMTVFPCLTYYTALGNHFLFLVITVLITTWWNLTVYSLRALPLWPFVQRTGINQANCASQRSSGGLHYGCSLLWPMKS